MEKNMENEVETLDPFEGVNRDITPLNSGESDGKEDGQRNGNCYIGVYRRA